MSLRLKIVIVFILCIILAFIPLLYVLETEIKSTNMDQHEHQTLQLIESKSKEIGSWLNQRISEIRIILEYPPSKELDFAQLRPYLTNLNQVLKTQYGNPNEIFAIGGLDGRGWINDTTTIDVSDRGYFNHLMNTDKDYIISDPVVSKFDNMPIFLISYPILDNFNNKIGFINGAVSLSKISQIAYDIDIYNGFSWIMNKDMNIYSIDSDTIKNKYISSHGLDTIVDHSLDRDSGIVKLKNLSGKDSTVFFSSVPYTENWLLCTIIEDDQIHIQTNTIINLILKLVVITVLAATFLAIIISGSIVKPIQELKYHMLKVSDGNLNSYYKLNSKDEISILGQVFNDMVDDIKGLIEKVYHVEGQKRNAELKTLQSQINPHFLYNTLDTAQWKALEHNAFEVADLINSLSGLFRIALSDGKEFITIDDEIQHVANYLEIQKIRYKDKINYKIQVEDSLRQYLTPKLIIQPLVENSVYHGLKTIKENGNIHIDISSKEAYLLIKVEDNGRGMEKDDLELLRKNLQDSIESEHYGLYNINERLRLIFGDKYKIIINSEFQVGTEVLIQIPLISEGFECLEC